MSNIKKVPLSLSRNYVRNWTVQSAIRELIANALDQGDYDFDCNYGLSINSYGGTIPEETLLLGNGSKTDGDNNIGQFNEGYKIALLVLCREGVSVEIQNGLDKWTPSIEYSVLYNTECLHVTIEYGYYDEDDCVKIELSDLDSGVIAEVEANTLVMQGDYEKHETPYGDILLGEEHKGRIFVGGLFVDNFKSDYGFDFPPSEFPLDRDRKSLKPFDIQWKTQYLWEHVSKEDSEEVAEEIIKGITRKDDSFQYADVKATNSIKKAAETLYNEQYSGKLVVSSYDEYKEEKAAGNDVELVNNDKLVRIIQQTDCYKTFSLGVNKVEKKSIEDLLDDFKDKWQDEMSSEMFYAYEDMVELINKQL